MKKQKSNDSKATGCKKVVVRDNYIAIEAYLKKQEKSLKNNLYLHLRKLIKEQINLRLVEGKNYKLRGELTKQKLKTNKQKNTSETNIWFIEKKKQN